MRRMTNPQTPHDDRFEADALCVLNRLDAGETLEDAIENVTQDGRSAHADALRIYFNAAPKYTTNAPSAAPEPRLCGHCGDVQPVGQSCGCFDNGCQ